jgi:hypothetical protein
LEQVLAGVCKFRQQHAAHRQEWGVDIDSITVELDLTVDGARNPPVAVAPDIQFLPTVTYGQIITANRGSTLRLTLKNPGTGAAPPQDCEFAKAAN